MKGSHWIFWHAVAVLTVAVWGGSFVSTKVLLNAGFLPTHVYLLRFVFAYLILLAVCHKKILSDSLKHELMFLVCGITAGSIYFIAENTALKLSYASNVSLIVCANPLMTMVLGGILYKGERLNARQVAGSLMTLFGMILVVLNGKFILKNSPVGDFLAFVAAFVWTVYSLVVRPLSEKYSALFISRKIFFYGSLTTLPVLLFIGVDIPWKSFREPSIVFNFLFLGIVASLMGYVAWNKVLNVIGTVLASNYIYSIPLVTIVISVIVLNERITPVAMLGTACILAGMILAEYRKR